MMLGKSPKNAPWLLGNKNNALQYLKNPDWNKWKSDPGVGLMMYAQVIEDYGWDKMRNVLTSYETENA